MTDKTDNPDVNAGALSSDSSNRGLHLAIIMDGNRRFAKRLMLEPWRGHELGKNKIEDLLNWCGDLGVVELTLYAFSLQNLHRPKREFDYLMRLFRDSFQELRSRLDELNSKGVRISFIGLKEVFPQDVQDSMVFLEEATVNNGPFKLNICMGYGGREELLSAVRAIARRVADGSLSPEDIDDSLLTSNLWLSSEPDLIIRTGGEKRTSNFLPWQSWYSEWFFLDKFWPEFSRDDLVACINEFHNRQRRFGR